MKKLFFLALIGLTMFSCKKETAQSKTILITMSNISSNTNYTIVAKNTNTGITVLSIPTSQGIGNQTFSFNANSGQVINMQYTFFTQGQQYGQGLLDVLCDSKTILHENGGSGVNMIINVP